MVRERRRDVDIDKMKNVEDELMIGKRNMVEEFDDWNLVREVKEIMMKKEKI